MQVASSFWRKTWRLIDDVVQRGEQGTRDGKEEMVTGTGAGTGTWARIGMGTRAGMGARTGAGTGDGDRDEGGGEREPGNLQSGNRGGSEDARGGAMPTSNQQPQPQDPTPQRHRRIMRRTINR